MESVTSGVIYDGEAFQIDHKVKKERLSAEVRSIIEVVTRKEEVEELPGQLYNIEQHSDSIVT